MLANREVALSGFTAPAAEIYSGYEEIMHSPNNKHPAAQLNKRFGIQSWEWPRLKLVVEAARMGDEYAQTLVKEIDAGDMTVSKAYRLLKEHEVDDNIVSNISSVNLLKMAEEISRSFSYWTNVSAALRRGVSLKKGNLSEEDLIDLLGKTRALSVILRQVSTVLSSSTSGGTKADGRKDQ